MAGRRSVVGVTSADSPPSAARSGRPDSLRTGGPEPAGWVRGADAAGAVRGGVPRRRPAYPVRRDAVTARGVRRVTHAKGAGESGLGRLIELHAVNTAGDAMVAVALANTLFFSVPTGEARGRVALYLLITMAPFAVMAPIIGPLLDRFRHGRRYAIAATMLARVLRDLGARRRRRRAASSRSTRRRSPAWWRPRPTASPGRPRSPGCCPRAARWSRSTPGSRWPASSPAPSAPASPACCR